MDRRQFFYSSASSLLGAYALTACSSFIGKPKAKNVKLLIATERDKRTSLITIYDMQDGSGYDFVLPLGLPHSTLMSPQFPESIFFFEVFGSAIRYNLRTGEMVTMKAGMDLPFWFNGHAVESHDGKTIWCTERLTGAPGNLVRARDAESLELLPGKENAYAGGHQVIRLPGTNILVSHPDKTINYFDTEKRQVIKEVSSPYKIVHLTHLSGSEMVGLGTLPFSKDEFAKTNDKNVREQMMNQHFIVDTEAPVIYSNLQGGLKTIFDESQHQLFRYNYGIDHIGPGSFLTSHVRSNTVILWENFQIKHTFSVISPLNVIHNRYRNSFYVASGGKLIEYSLVDYKELKAYSFPKSVLMMATMKI